MRNWAINGLVLTAARVGEHVVVVAVVVNVFVLGNQMDVQDADVHAKTGLAIPERVVRLRGVCHVVGGL